MRRATAALAFLLLSSLPSAADGAAPFADAKTIDLLALLPPPPDNDSMKTKIELGEVLTLQVTRTPAQAAQSLADSEEDVWRFADAVGNPKFRAENLPKFTAFFARVFETEGAVVDPAKDIWKRPRPFQLSDLVKPSAKISKSGAWPSGHATVGTLAGIVLSSMLPELRARIMARAWDYAEMRVIGGVHFRSDIEMGRIAGADIAHAISRDSVFRAEFEAARAEARTVLGL